jgi:DNA-binding NarL/FixJ family response regulator
MDAGPDRRDPVGMACRVLIVEDDDAFAEILRVLLESDGRFEIVGRARDGVEGIELTRELHPDVVSMDIDMPRTDGVEATKAIRGADPTQRIVVVSGSIYRDRINAARLAGAQGFVTKSRAPHDLTDVLVAVCGGESFVTAA